MSHNLSFSSDDVKTALSMKSSKAHLNPEQRQAVTYIDGPILVLAGAGTGKTTVLVERVKYLIQECNIDSQNILATTFTVKATEEMRQRLQTQNISVPEWIGTFHSLCIKIVRAHASKLNLDPNFKVIEGEQQKYLCKRLFGQKGDEILEQINIWKNHCKKPNDVYEHHEYKNSYAQYQKILLEDNSLDFGDLIMECCILWQNNPEVLAQYQEQFKYICIDEFQDTNFAQFSWLKLLTQGQDRPNLFCVGDDDQAIYTWRGSDNKYILNFHYTYPNAKIIKLEQNYRSTAAILRGALNIVSRNKQRLGKVLHSNKGEGEEISVHNFVDEIREGEWIINNLLKEKGSVGILLRTAWQVQEIKRLLQQKGILGASGLKVLFMYLHFINNPTPENFAIVLQNPKRGIGDKTVEKFLHLCKMHATKKDADQAFVDEFIENEFEDTSDIYEKSNEYSTQTPTTQIPELDFSQMCDIITELCNREPAKTALNSLIEQLKFWMHHKQDLHHIIKDIWKTFSLGELQPVQVLQIVNRYPILSDFLKHFSLPEIDIMTIHAAKGLEFDAVYLIAWEENLFPHINSIMTNDIESERRLAYVAITRGKQKVYITHVLSRRTPRGVLRKGVSRFIHEL